MVQALPKILTLEEYLEYDFPPDSTWELENGVLRKLPAESELNRQVAMMLVILFSRLGIPFQRLSHKTDVVVSSGRATVRNPDLLVLLEPLPGESLKAKSSTVLQEMPPPDLAVEGVSPGREAIARDYRQKRTEYAICQISEYWIVDPNEKKVSTLTLVDGFYDVAEFPGEMAIASPFLQSLITEFPNTLKNSFSLKAVDVLTPQLPDFQDN